jgi:hypothetical protein
MQNFLKSKNIPFSTKATKAELKDLIDQKIKANTATSEQNQPSADDDGSGKNRFGHRVGTQAQRLDDMLLEGLVVEKAMQELSTTRGRIKKHVNHLRKDKKVEVVNAGGVYRIESAEA